MRTATSIFIVDVDDGWMENIAHIAVAVSAMVQSENQLWIDTTDADLRSSIEAGLTADATAGD